MMRVKNANGFTLAEMVIAFGLLGILVIAMSSLASYSTQAAMSSWGSLDYAAFSNRIFNIVLNDSFCTAALTGAPQTFPNAGPVAVKLYKSPGVVEFEPGVKYNSLTIQSIDLYTLNSAAPPNAIGGVWPSQLVIKVLRSDNNHIYTLRALLNVSTATTTFQIQKCNKIKFSDKNYAVPPCPAAGPVAGCNNPAGVPYLLTIANDGVTPICTPDWTQCCDANSYAALTMGSDPRSQTGVVTCKPRYCEVTGDTYAKGICCSHGLQSYGPHAPASCP